MQVISALSESATAQRLQEPDIYHPQKAVIHDSRPDTPESDASKVDDTTTLKGTRMK